MTEEAFSNVSNASIEPVQNKNVLVYTGASIYSTCTSEPVPADSVLNRQVSCFKNYKSAKEPININLSNWLTCTKYKDRVEEIRSISDKSKRDELKSSLPAITPSCRCEERNQGKIIEHSGLIQFDIDKKDNQRIKNYTDLKKQIANIPNVAYCGLSVSGLGFWGLIPIRFPGKHKEYFLFIVNYFDRLGIKTDPAPASIVSLRGYSYDADAYFNHYARPLISYMGDNANHSQRPLNGFKNGTKEDRFLSHINEINNRKIDITQSYKHWYQIGFALASEFGEKGRKYFHEVSKHHSRYNPAEADKKYIELSAKGKNNFSIGTFFHYCKESGINLNF